MPTTAATCKCYRYGEEITSTANDTFKFAQTYRDSDSGLDYARNRYYASGIGRFVTADSVGGHPTTPQTWNLYAYSDSDPVNMFDPQGRDGCWLDGVQVSCCVFTESKRLGRRSSFDPDPMRALDDGDCGDPGGGGPGPQPSASFSCSITAWSVGTASLQSFGGNYGFLQPVGLTVSASNWDPNQPLTFSGTQSFSWTASVTTINIGSRFTGHTQTTTGSGSGTEPAEFFQDGGLAAAEDAPGVPTVENGGVVIGFPYTWTATMTLWATNGSNGTVPCTLPNGQSTFTYSINMSWSYAFPSPTGNPVRSVVSPQPFGRGIF
jgi:RHS repeat-associated protein